MKKRVNKKIKNKRNVELPMKFNPGTAKYEPILPLNKNKEEKTNLINVNWWKFILFMALAIAIIGATIVAYIWMF